MRSTVSLALLPEIEATLNPRLSGSVRESRIHDGFKGKAAIYLPAEARWDYLASLPAGGRWVAFATP